MNERSSTNLSEIVVYTAVSFLRCAHCLSLDAISIKLIRCDIINLDVVSVDRLGCDVDPTSMLKERTHEKELKGIAISSYIRLVKARYT